MAVLAAASLTACSIQGNAAEKWLGGSSIIESTSINLNGCSATCDPVVTGIISESASEAQIRRLAEAATEYLPRKAPAVEMTLKYGNVGFDIAPTVDETTRIVDRALAISGDDRVSSASINVSDTYMTGPKAELPALWAEYSAPGSAPMWLADDAETGSTLFRISNTEGGCDASPSLVAEFDRLLLNPSVSTVTMELCTTLDVTVNDRSARDTMIAELQPLASDPALSTVAFRILVDDDPAFSVTADTPQLAPLFALLDSTPGVESYWATGSAITVSIADVSLFRSVATTVDTAPRPEVVERITLAGGGASIYSDGDGTTEAQIGLAEAIFAMEAAGESVHFAAHAQPESSLEFTPEEYDSAVGRHVVDAVMASGLWKTSSTVIAVYDPPVVFTVRADSGAPGLTTTRSNPDENPDITTVISDLNTYWVAQQAAAQ